MGKRTILTKAAPAPIGPYSQAVEVNGLLFCAGQIPIEPSTGEVMSAKPVKEQAELVLKNVGAVLAGAGLTYAHVVKSTIYLVDMNDFNVVNEAYAQHFRDDPPARTTIAVAALPKGVRVEIEVIAAK